MGPVFTAFARALRDIGQPRILAVLLVPMLGAIVIWSVLAWLYWDSWSGALRAMLDGTAVARWLVEHGAAWLISSTAALLVLVLLLPAMLITAILVTELVAMPAILSVVGRAYPGLEKAAGGSILGSIINAGIALTVFALLWIVTLPLWLTGIGAVLLPAFNAAYLNQRLFRYEALAEHASRDEYRGIVARTKGSLYTLGLLAAFLYYVPFVNLIAPVVSGLAFTHFCLRELAQLRLNPIS
ncbi:MAG TPA: EI24 domain-containing protein [Burkholderiales bacterium]|nr:EI24 domain-containing protein [Burkholderiales bacterium]